MQLLDVIQSCMSETLGLPEDKRADRFMPMEKVDFYYSGGRRDAYTVIEINMMEARELDTKRL